MSGPSPAGRRRYRGRSAPHRRGIGFAPILFLVVLALFEWRVHGGGVSDLRNLRYALFH